MTINRHENACDGHHSSAVKFGPASDVTIDGSLENNGIIAINGGTLAVTGAVTGTGTFDIEKGGRLVLGGAVSPSETIDISNGVLEFTKTAPGPKFTASGVVTTDLMTIGDITSHSTIQVDGKGYGQGGLASVLLYDITSTGGLLDLAQTVGGPAFLVQVAGHFIPTKYYAPTNNYSSSTAFRETADSSGNAIITLNPNA